MSDDCFVGTRALSLEFIGVLQATLGTFLRFWAIDSSLPIAWSLCSELIFGLMFAFLASRARHAALPLSNPVAALAAAGSLFAGCFACLLAHQGILGLGALLVGDVLVNLGRCWAIAICGTGIALSCKFDDAAMSSIIPVAAVGASYLFFASISSLGSSPILFALAIDIALGIGVGFMMCRHSLSDAHCSCRARTPEELEVTNPLSFIPVLSKFYLALFVFEMAFGMGVLQSLSRTATNESFPILGLSMLALSVVIQLASRQHPCDDWLLNLCAILVIGGLSFESTASPISRDARLIVAIGAQCFYALTWAALTTAGSRNPIGAPLTICRGFSVSTLGSFMGGAYVFLSGELFPSAGSNIPLAIVETLLFIVLWLFLRDFRIEEIFRSLAPLREDAVISLPSSDKGDLSRAISELAKSNHLTAREREVAGLLALGKNGASIQEELVISKNTAKTHIRHIYQKLNVHSQQELIELVSGHSSAEGKVNDKR